MQDTVEKFAIPIAIVIAGALIAGALYFSNSGTAAQVQPGANGPQATAQTVSAVRADDHIMGNPKAKITIVEFSDPECPFCKRFHETMHKIMNNYGKDGDVAWVYRHLPLPQLHQKAQRESEALACAAQVGGNENFWKYADGLYAITPSNDGLEDTQLFTIAKNVGLDAGAFKDCVDNGKAKKRVDADVEEANALGINGTPQSFILFGDQQIPIEGAQPYEVIKQLIDQLLKK